MLPYGKVLSESQRKKYAERKDELSHPTKTKLKKAIKKAGKVLDRAHQLSETAANTRKAIKG